MNEFIQKYFQEIKDVDEYSLDKNIKYFSALYEKFLDEEGKELKIHEPENDIISNILPLPILNTERYPVIQDYCKLSENIESLKDYNLILCKMNAGLGSSVERADELKKLTGRIELGSKGTDLFLSLDGKNKSLAELQLAQTEILKKSNIFNDVKLQNLVNHETLKEVEKLKNENVKENILQLKMPTICDEKLTNKRVAPAGHAFLGFSFLSKIFSSTQMEQELIVIGNGEDLNSTPDSRIFAWVAENQIPITMITTTKLEKDKKGGQISVVTGEIDYVTIVEKAQAQKSGQLEYFEKLGLRENDKKSLFNTNIIVINAKVLKEKLSKLEVSEDEFHRIISPDLIKNNKTENGKVFTQLEGAIGSTMLNLDKFFRLNVGEPVVSFLNLDPDAREKFFIPIKTIEDFNELKEKYNYNSKSGRFDLKEK